MSQPGDGPAQRRQGLEALQQGRWDDAITALSAYVALAPQDAETLVMLGVAYSQSGRHADALLTMDRAARLAPQAAPVHTNRGLVLERGGLPEEAVQAFQEALRLNPNDTRATQRLAALRQGKAPAPASPAAPSPPRLDARPAPAAPVIPPAHYAPGPPSPATAPAAPPPGAVVCPHCARPSAPGIVCQWCGLSLAPPPPPPVPAPLGEAAVLGARASNPGRLKVHFLAYLRCFPSTPLILAGLVGFSILLALFGPPRAWIALLVVLALCGLGLQRLNEYFWSGDVNPAGVVSVRPYLVAVYGDLTTQADGYWPVIKILPQPLDRMTGGPPPLGTRLATVAMYDPNNATAEHWGDFWPRVINCVSNSRADIARVLASIPEDDWARLEEGLRQVPAPHRPGLFPVRLAPPGPPPGAWRR